MPVSTTSWKPGHSGNPGGRPRVVEAVRDIARESTTLAVETLRQICADAEAPHAARVSAASALLDRGWGRPMQGHAVMAVTQQRSLVEMSDAELLQLIQEKTQANADTRSIT